MKVFISHQQEDSACARTVASGLRQYGWETYLDVIDSALQEDGPGLSDYIREQMSKCTQLLSVISSSTKNSWWVPWEIGVASEKDFLIATYVAEHTELPSYLKKWPCLMTLNDIAKYVRLSNTANSRIRTAYAQHRASIARNFHRELRRSLGQ